DAFLRFTGSCPAVNIGRESDGCRRFAHPAIEGFFGTVEGPGLVPRERYRKAPLSQSLIPNPQSDPKPQSSIPDPASSILILNHQRSRRLRRPSSVLITHDRIVRRAVRGTPCDRIED